MGFFTLRLHRVAIRVTLAYFASWGLLFTLTCISGVPEAVFDFTVIALMILCLTNVVLQAASAIAGLFRPKYLLEAVLIGMLQIGNFPIYMVLWIWWL